MGCYPSFHLSLFLCCFCFSSLRCHPRFYLCLIFSSFGTKFLGTAARLNPSLFVSSFAFSSLRCRSRSHHHLDNILGSICVHFYFLRFPIIGMSSQVLCRLMFVLFITYHWNAFLGFLYVYYQFPQFPILVPLVYLHQDAIVVSIYVQFQFLSLGCHPSFYLSLVIFSFGLPSPRRLSSFIYVQSQFLQFLIVEMQSQVSTSTQLVVSLVSHCRNATLVSIYVRSQFLWFLIIEMSFQVPPSFGQHSRFYMCPVLLPKVSHPYLSLEHLSWLYLCLF